MHRVNKLTVVEFYTRTAHSLSALFVESPPFFGKDVDFMVICEFRYFNILGRSCLCVLGKGRGNQLC